MENNQQVVPPQPPVSPVGTPPPVSPQTAGSNKRKIFLIGGFLIIIALLGYGIFLFASNSRSPQTTLPTPTPSLTPSPTIVTKLSPTITQAKPTLQPFPPKTEYVEDELIIRYKEGMGPAQLQDPERIAAIKSVFEEVGVVSQEPLYKDTADPSLKNFYLLHFKQGTDIEEAARKIYELPEVIGAEPNGKVVINQ